MRGLLDARGRPRGTRGDGVCHCLWGAGEGGSVGDSHGNTPIDTDADHDSHIHAASDCNRNTLADADVHAASDCDRYVFTHADANLNSDVHAASDCDRYALTDIDTPPLILAAGTYGIRLVVMGQS